MTTAAIPAPTPVSDIVRTYVWEVPVRVAHWLIVISILLLSITGFYIGRPFIIVSGPAAQHFVMGWMKVIHFWAAWLFVTALTMRLVWMFTGNKYAHWDKFIPVHPTRLRGIWPTVKFYIFALRKPPGFVGHNPVAASAYTLVYGLCLLEVATGFVMHGASSPTSFLHGFGGWAWLFGGLAMARWIHHIVMWLLLGFTVHHVYSAVLMSIVEANATIESIFSGYKFVPREDLQYSGYRFINRKGQIDE